MEKLTGIIFLFVISIEDTVINNKNIFALVCENILLYCIHTTIQ